MLNLSTQMLNAINIRFEAFPPNTCLHIFSGCYLAEQGDRSQQILSLVSLSIFRMVIGVSATYRLPGF